MQTLPIIKELDESEKSGFHLRQWAIEVKRWGLSGIVAALMESGNAFSTLAAQSLYISQPFLETWISREKLGRLASLLEEPGASAIFVKALKDENP